MLFRSFEERVEFQVAERIRVVCLEYEGLVEVEKRGGVGVVLVGRSSRLSLRGDLGLWMMVMLVSVSSDKKADRFGWSIRVARQWPVFRRRKCGGGESYRATARRCCCCSPGEHEERTTDRSGWAHV